MMRSLFRIDHDHKRPFRRDGNEIRVRNLITFPAGRMDFVRNERHGTIELTDRLDDHQPILV